MKRKLSKVIAFLLSVVMLVSVMPMYAFADALFNESQLSVVTDKASKLANGVEQNAYTVYDKNGEQVKMFVTTADMNVDTVKLFASYKDMDPTNFGMSKLTDQVAAFNKKAAAGDEYYRGTVVAGINASYYNMITGQPTGIFVMNGVVGNANESAGYFAVMKDGSVKIGKKGSYAADKDNIQEAIGIHTMLVENGQICSGLDSKTKYPRQTIGITADNRVILMTADGNQAPSSVGLTILEQAQVMKDLGCVWAGHLDGGGSTTYACKPEGSDDFVIKNNPSDGSERSVSNGFIIVSTEAASYSFDHVTFAAEHEYVTPGTSVNVAVAGASSTGNAADIPADVTYKVDNGKFENGVFTAGNDAKDAIITAMLNGKEVGSTTIHVVIPTALSFENNEITVPYGKTVELALKATCNNGLNEVLFKAEDIDFTLENSTVGSISGLNFTAGEEGAAAAQSSITAKMVFDADIIASANINLGKGSEVLFDFEDGTTNGFGLSYSGYNYYLPNSSVYSVDATTGKVHSGNKALALNVDYSNSLESGYQMIGMYRISEEDIYRENAKQLGLWIYIPDEDVSLWARWMNVDATGVDENGKYTVGGLTSQTVDGTIDGKTGYVYSFEESGWHYLSIDLSSAKGAVIRSGYYCMQFYISDRAGAAYGYDGLQSKNSGQYTNVNGNYTFYIDDVTVDYSSAVDDRDAPVFSELNYGTTAMADAVGIAKRSVPTINYSNVDFAAKVAENTSKSNASGLDASTAKAYVDGNEVACTYSGGVISMNNTAVLSDGQHTIKFSICDMQGNYASIIRQVNIQAGKGAAIKVVPHDSNANRVLLGSVNHIDVVASNIENIASVSLKMDLDNMSKWQLDHMQVAEGFEASWSMNGADKAENIAALNIVRTGNVTEAGEKTLVSIPVRMWSLDNPVTVGTKVYDYTAFKNSKESWPISIDLTVDQGSVEFTDGTSDTFTGKNVRIGSEMWGSYAYMTMTEEGKAYWNSWNGGHTHTPAALADKSATCTESGYTGRTYCDVCDSVVDWGETVSAAGHIYAVADRVLKCSSCGILCNGEYNGKTYIDGIAVNGWIDDSYYTDGVKLKGLQEIDGIYYDFGDQGVCPNRVKLDGFYYDSSVSAYRYFAAGKMSVGDVAIYPNVHFFDETGCAISGDVSVLGYKCHFSDKGEFVSADNSDVVDAGYCGTNVQYVLLSNGTLKIDGEGALRDYSSKGIYPGWIIKNEPNAVTVVEIGSHITEIGKFAFFRNQYLREIKFENNSSLKTIGWGAFGHCWRLAKVTLPASVEMLKEYAFYECGALKSFDVEKGSKLKTISDSVFVHDIWLESVYIPDSVTDMGEDIFYTANADVVLNVAENSIAHAYAEKHNMKFTLRKGAVEPLYQGDLTDTISWKLYPSGTLSIEGSGAMPNYTSHTQQPWAAYRNEITHIVISKDITSVGNYAFCYAQNVKSVIFEENSKTSNIGVLSFFNLPKITEVTLPETVTSINSNAFGDCFELTKLYVPQRVNFIYHSAFSNCNKINLNVAEGSYAEQFAIDRNINYTVREYVYEIIEKGSCGDNANWELYENGELRITGSGAMENYSSHKEQPWASSRHKITKIVIGKDITSVGNYAFCYSQNVKSVVFEDGSKLTNVGVLSFFNLPQITEVVLPDTVTSINSYAFGDCFELTNLYVSQNADYIYHTAFTNSDKVTLNVAKGTYAESFAAEHNINYVTRELKPVPVAEGLCGADAEWALYENGELRITGSGAMDNYASHKEQPWASSRHKITKIVIGKDITSVGNYAFCYSQNVTSVEFEEGSKVLNIGILSFFNLPQITEVTLPETVTSINSYAFGDCFKLANVYIPQEVSFIYRTAFTNSSNVILSVAKGSYAEKFAVDNNINNSVR